MITYHQISRWLSGSAFDPIAIEDWIANRQLFGPVEKPEAADLELEAAFALESECDSDKGTKGLYENGQMTLLCCWGKTPKEACIVSWKDDKGKEKKLSVSGGGFIKMEIPESKEAKLKISCRNNFKISGKNETTWQGNGERKVIVEAILV